MSGATGCDQVVDDEDAISGLNGVAMDLQRIGTVFQLVAHGIGLTGQLAGFAGGNEPGSEFERDRDADHEATCLGSDDLGDTGIAKMIGDGGDGVIYRVGIGKQGRDVFEDDTRLRVVRNVGDEGLEIKFGHDGASFYSFAIERFLRGAKRRRRGGHGWAERRARWRRAH